MFGPSQEAFHGCLNDDQLRGSDPQSRDYECTETCADDLDPGRAVLVMFAWDDICFLSYFVVTASLMLVFLNSGRERERERKNHQCSVTCSLMLLTSDDPSVRLVDIRGATSVRLATRVGFGSVEAPALARPELQAVAESWRIQEWTRLIVLL